VVPFSEFVMTPIPGTRVYFGSGRRINDE